MGFKSYKGGTAHFCDNCKKIQCSNYAHTQVYLDWAKMRCQEWCHDCVETYLGAPIDELNNGDPYVPENPRILWPYGWYPQWAWTYVPALRREALVVPVTQVSTG